MDGREQMRKDDRVDPRMMVDVTPTVTRTGTVHAGC